MSFVRTLVLILVAAALGAWLWLVEAPKADLEAKKTFLLDIDPATVAKVRLAYGDGTQIVVERDGDKWKMTAPIAYAADTSVVENFLTTIKETKISRRLPKSEAGALSAYGLEGDTGSQARLEVTLKDGKALPAVVLGIATPVGYDAFARQDGSDDVLVIPLLLQSSAKKSPQDLRLKSMFAGDAAPIKHVTIEKPGEKVELERHGDAAWTMTSPLEDGADAETVRSMLDSISTIDAIAFYDGPQADRAAFGLDDAAATRFTATRDDGTTVAFSIGKDATDAPAGSYFERASDHQVVKVPDWVAKKFSPPASEFREKRLLSCRIDEVRSLTWSMGNDTFTVSRSAPGNPWTIAPAIDGEVLNQRIVDNVLNSVVLARADAVVGDAKTADDLHAFGLDQPIARLEVSATTGTCASLAAAAAPSMTAPAEQAPGMPPAPPRPAAPTFYIKDASRSAVLRASAHEYSRVAMKRAEIVDAAPAAATPTAAPTAGSATGTGEK